MQNIIASERRKVAECACVTLHDRNFVAAYLEVHRTLRYVQCGIEQPVQTTRSARSLHLLTIILMCALVTLVKYKAQHKVYIPV